MLSVRLQTYAKIKRCDANRPVCGTCKISRPTDSVCTYEFKCDDSRTPKDSEDALSASASSRRSEEPSQSLTLSSATNHDKTLHPDSFRINSAASFPDIAADPLKPHIISNPWLSLSGIDDPSAFALSQVSLDDLNMRLYVPYMVPAKDLSTNPIEVASYSWLSVSCTVSTSYLISCKQYF